MLSRYTAKRSARQHSSFMRLKSRRHCSGIFLQCARSSVVYVLGDSVAIWTGDSERCPNLADANFSVVRTDAVLVPDSGIPSNPPLAIWSVLSTTHESIHVAHTSTKDPSARWADSIA